MAELKFVFNHSEPLPDEPTTSNIHLGKCTFATQNTAVYSDFVLIRTPDEILRIQADCTKAFAFENIIALLNGTFLDIYKEMKHTNNYTLTDDLSRIICDCPNLGLLQKLVSEQDKPDSIASIFGGRVPYALFSVNNSFIAIFADSIEYSDKKFTNFLHSDGCKYFVAQNETAIIIANNKSERFIYIMDDVLVNPEECDSLGLRIDDDFEPCMLEDMKFHGSELILKDSTHASIYKLKDAKTDETKVEIVRCTINDGIISKDTENNTNDKTSTSITKLFEIDEKKSVSTNTSNKVPDLFSESELKKSLDKSAAQESKITSASLFSASTKQNKTENKEERDADILKKELGKTIGFLKKSFDDLKLGLTLDITMLDFVPAKCDFSLLYKLINNSSLDEYIQVMERMVLQAKAIQKTLPDNIEESIKYFDRRIISRNLIARNVTYKEPLAARLAQVCRIEDRTIAKMEPISKSKPVSRLEGPFLIKSQSLSFQSRLETRESGTPANQTNQNATNNKSIAEPIAEELKNSNKLEVSNNISTINFSKEPSNNQSMMFKNQLAKEDSKVPTALFGKETTHASDQKTISLFSTPGNTSQSLFTSQPGSLFSDQSVFQSSEHTKPDANTPQEGASTLSRFASSRRMFR